MPGVVGVVHRRRPRARRGCRSCGRSPRTSRSRTTSRSRRTGSGSPATRSRWWWPRRANRRWTPRRPSSVDVTALPAVTDMEAAMADGAPLIHEELGTNVTCTGATAARATSRSSRPRRVIVTERYRQPRLIPNAIEPRGCLAYGVPRWASTRCYVHPDPAHREGHAARRDCGIPESEAARDRARRGRRVRLEAERLRRGGVWPSAWRRSSGRPVKWIEERSENYVATIHGRGVIHDMHARRRPRTGRSSG